MNIDDFMYDELKELLIDKSYSGLGIRNRIISDIYNKKPRYICVGLLTTLEIKMLLFGNYAIGYPKHLLFSIDDGVECFIEIKWGE